MTRPASDRVKVEWTGVGTGTMTLGAAVAGFQTFPSTLNGLIVSYLIEHTTSTEAEAGYGTYTSSGTTLSRTYRTYPTLGGSAVNFSAGTKHVRLIATHLDFIENRATSTPGVTDDIDAGYIAGRSRWLNTSTNALYFCVNHTSGAAVWIQIGVGSGTITSVNGDTGPVVTLAGNEIASTVIPANYTPVGSPTTLDSHFSGIDTALGAIAVGTDAVPTQVTSGASPFALTTAARLHNNVEVLSHASTVDFEVATTATAGSKWYIRPLHSGCTVSVNTDVGSVNGTAGGDARIINGGVAIVEVASNAGSAPVVLVRGDVIVPPTSTSGKTYTNDDHGQDFRITTGTQVFSAVANYRNGFYTNLILEVAGTITIDGVDADYTMSGPDVVTVMKAGTAFLAIGKAGVVILDAA